MEEKKEKKRKINYEKIIKFFMSFLVGFFVCAISGFRICFFVPIVFALIFFIGLIFKKKIRVEGFSFLATAAFLGAVWFSFNVFFSFNFSQNFDERVETVVGEIKDFEQYENGKMSYLIKVKSIGEEKVFNSFNVKLFLNEELDCDYFDVIRVKLRLKSSIKREWFGLFDANFSNKVFLFGKVVSDIYIEEKDSFFAKFLNFRDSMIDNVNLFVEEPYNFLVRGIVFGKMNGIPFEMRRAINICGLSHVFAISGLHIAILSIFIILILRFFRLPGVFSFILLFICMFIYAFIVGFSPSVLRACFMTLSVSFAMLFNKKIKSFESLSFAAFSIVLIWPFSALGLSFILSFSSCFGIIFLKDKILKFILYRLKVNNKFIILILEGFSISLSATFATSIFIMFVFGKISIIAPFVNLLVVPFLPVIYVVSILLCVFAFFSNSIPTVLGYFCEGFFGSLFYCLKYIIKFPFCYIPTNYFFVKVIIVSFSIFVVFYFFISKKFVINKKFFLVCFFIVVLPFSLNCILKRNITKLYFVGTGFSSNIVIKGQGKTVVVNCGGSDYFRDNFVNFLDSKGISKVDVFILASCENRHISGATDFLKVISPTCAVLSKSAQRCNIVDYFDPSKTRVILNEKFYLEYLPISINVVNKGKNFGFYLNINGTCFAYSKSLDFMYEMCEKRRVNFAIFDEKIEDLEDVELLNVEKCLGVLNGDFSNDFFESCANDRPTEFLIDKDYIKRGEI